MNQKMNHILLRIAIILLLIAPSLSMAKPEYMAKEGHICSYCHSSDGPPQLNDRGVYYATHDHSLQGYVEPPKTTPTPEPTKEIEIGIHMNTWDVGLTALLLLLSMLVVVYVIRL